jgi:hypothetical protein
MAAVAMVTKVQKKGGLKERWDFSSNFMKHRRNIHCSVWKLLACWYNSKWRYYGNRGTKIMGWGDVRYCLAMAILVIIIILIIILPHIFVRSISRRCHDQTLWNLVGMPYPMWSCAV